MQQLMAREHFAELSSAVGTLLQHEVLKKYRREWTMFGLRVAGYIVGLGLFSVDFLALRIIGFVICSYALYSIAITGMHESRHDALSPNHAVNRFWGYVFGDFWSGESNIWWYDHHVRDHHVFTNVKGHDEPYFNAPWLNKYLYFWILPFFAVPFLFALSIKYLWGRWNELEFYLILFFGGFAFQSLLFAQFVSWPAALLLTFAARSLFTPFFLHLALFNHIALPFYEQRPAWLPHQAATTRNVAYHWFLAGLGGNAFVHRHVEHHLFPTLPNNTLEKISPLVKKIFKKYNYPYIEQHYTDCLAYCIKNYKKLFTPS